MGLKLGWLAVRGVEAAALVPVLERAKAQVRVEDRPAGFRVVDAPVPRPSMIDSLLGRPAPAPFASALLTGPTFDSAAVWAEAVSEELGALAISFVVLDGTWSYIIYDRGERVLSMSLEKVPTLSGDVAKAAALLGVEEGLFERYRSEIELASELSHDNTVAAVYERLSPLRGDEHHPSAEWGHLDFAKRLGRIAYPEPGTGVEIDWSRPLPTLSRRDLESALDTGSDVVHSALGIGQVVRFDTADGRPMVEVRFADNRLLKMSRATLRPLMNEADLKATFDVLSEPTPEGEASAERSHRHVQLVKIGTGPALAEVVRDLVREARATKLSVDGERLLDSARTHLANEIARIRKTSPEDVQAELTEACRLI